MSIRTLTLAIIVVTVASVVLGSIEARAPMTASELDALVPVETAFPEPQTITWEGEVFGVLMSGQGIAVRMRDTGVEFQAYMPEGESTSIAKGRVRIRGTWTGISCAYAYAMFSGTCTPTVDIDELVIIQ
jgi:hypothetical protein